MADVRSSMVISTEPDATPMESAVAGSVTRLLDSLRGGSEAAATRLWDLYFSRMMRLAHKQLGKTDRAIRDEEDIALSAFHSTYRGLRRRCDRDDMDREALWRLIATITLRKVYDYIAYRGRKKRSPTNAAGAGRLEIDHPEVIESLVARDPTPSMLSEFDEGFEELLDSLRRPELKQIVVLKLEGYTNREIATQLGRGLSSIERKLKTIREVWRDEQVVSLSLQENRS